MMTETEANRPEGRAARGGEPGPGALDRGLAILSHLAEVKSATTAELARELDLTRSTAYRLVERLRGHGWLTQEIATGQWRLGPAAARLASAAVASTDLRDAAAPVLRILLERTQETVSLAVPHGLGMVFIHRELGPQPAAVTAELGSTRPLHSSSLGRAYLAALDDARLEEVLMELVASGGSPVSAANVSLLHEEVMRTRERGWAEDRREFDESSVCCGAAVRDHSGLPVAAVSVAGVAERMEPLLDRIGPLVAQACAELSANLGYVPENGRPGQGG